MNRKRRTDKDTPEGSPDGLAPNPAPCLNAFEAACAGAVIFLFGVGLGTLIERIISHR